MVDPIQASRQPRARSNLTRGWPFLPAGVVLLVLFLLPMTVMVAFSLWRTNSDLDIVPDWTLDNYIYFFSEGTYVRTFLKTLIMAAAVTAAGIATALPFAYFLVRYVGQRWQRIVLLAVIVPFWTSYLLRAYAWQAIYTALEKFDFNQLNAAQDLGARPDQAFRRILLPQIRPGVITACIFVFVPILGEFLTPTLVGGAQGALIANLIINFFRGLQYTTMAAFSFVIAGFVIVVLVIFRRYLRVEDVVARG